MKQLWRRANWFLHRKQFEEELEEEMRHHLSMKAEEMKGGEMKQFGNPALLKEDSRAVWTPVFWEQLLQDIRYGLRSMASHKVFTAMATLSLALGIGANTVIFSFMDAILLRALPVRRPDRLVILNWRARRQSPVITSFSGGGYPDPKTGFTSAYHAYPAIDNLRAHNSVLESLFMFSFQGRGNLIYEGQAGLANGEFVSGGYFSGLGIVPAAGRLIAADDDRPGAPPVVVFGWDYWRSRFAANPAAIGRTILINESAYTILGAASPGFYGESPASRADFFMPLHLIPDPRHRRFSNGHYYWVSAMGRLRDGVTPAQAQVALAPVYGAFVGSTAQTAEQRVDLPGLLLQEGGSGVDSLRRQYSQPLFVLMTMVGLILIIACANIANLLLARSEYRRPEMAVRVSLGAGGLRIIRQLLTESLLLSLVGGALGVVVAIPGIRLIGWLIANGRDAFHLDATLDWRVLSFTLALTLFAGILFGLAPALHSTKDFRAASRVTNRSRLRRALVVSQIAISLLVIAAAGLFVRTLSNLESIELGFDREHVLLLSMSAGQEGYRGAALVRFYDGLLASFRALPGVRNASLSDMAFVSGDMHGAGVKVPGGPAPAGREAGTDLARVGPSFFSTMRLPVLAGREIDERDVVGSKPVAVVNEVLARKYFPNENPIGRRVGIGGDAGKFDEYEIVGVARAARYDSLKRGIPPVTYLSYAQDPAVLNYVVFELRTAGDPLAVATAVRQIVRGADARVPVFNITSQSKQIDQTLGQERTFADLCASFAGLALVISCVGLYGTMAYAVARRTSEIGIRMALGAQRRGVTWMVVREMLVLAAFGLAIGLVAVWQTSHLVASFLWGVKPNDPTVLAAASAILIACALAAGFAPAWRASRIDPMEALRHE
jgi:predicted permease